MRSIVERDGEAIALHVLALRDAFAIALEGVYALARREEAWVVDVEDDPARRHELPVELAQYAGIGRLVVVAKALPQVDDGAIRPRQGSELTHVVDEVGHRRYRIALRARAPLCLGDDGGIAVEAGDVIAVSGEQARVPAPATT